MHTEICMLSRWLSDGVTHPDRMVAMVLLVSGTVPIDGRREPRYFRDQGVGEDDI